MDCVKANGTNGCNGGDPTAAYSYILDNGIPDETCSNYEVGLTQGGAVALLYRTLQASISFTANVTANAHKLQCSMMLPLMNCVSLESG